MCPPPGSFPCPSTELGRHHKERPPVPLLWLLWRTIGFLLRLPPPLGATLLPDPDKAGEGGNEAALLHGRQAAGHTPEPAPGAAAGDNELQEWFGLDRAKRERAGHWRGCGQDDVNAEEYSVHDSDEEY